MSGTMRQEAILRAVRTQRITGEELARHFRVKVRTIYRDIAHLRERGVHVSGIRGPGGGFLLSRAARPLQISVSTEAVRELALAVTLLARRALLPVTKESGNLLNQLLGSLPGAEEAEIRRVCQDVVVEPTDAALPEPKVPLSGLLSAIQRAIVGNRRVWLNVQTRWDDRQFLALGQLSLVGGPRGWALRGVDRKGVAHTHTLRSIKTFRLTHARVHPSGLAKASVSARHTHRT